jgi:hypothetical protein
MANVFKQVFIGPDGKLRAFLHAVIFYCLGSYFLYERVFHVVAYLARPLHIQRALSWQFSMLTEPTNLITGLICTGIFALYEHRRVDSYGMPVNRALSLPSLEGAAAGVIMAGLVGGWNDRAWRHAGQGTRH